MSIIAWIFLGLIAGYVASKLVNRQGEGFFLDIALGIVGAIVGGFFFTRMGAAGVTGFNLYSMFVAMVGAVAVLALMRPAWSTLRRDGGSAQVRSSASDMTAET